VENLTPLAVWREDAVEHDGVEVKVQIQASAESLDEVERAMLRSTHVGATLLSSRDLLNENTPERRRHIGTKCCKAPQLKGQREYVLPHRNRGQDAVHHVRRRVAHAPCAATRTEAALFT
jgi:hypothetical protein